MAATMTYVGLDVHARSTHAAAIDVASGELRRARFGGGSDEVIAWLQSLPQPLHSCYEAGPTGFALYRAAEAAGLRLDVVAPSKTPRAPGDRIKSDRKDAELFGAAAPGRAAEAGGGALAAARGRSPPRARPRAGARRSDALPTSCLEAVAAARARLPGERLDEDAPPLARGAAFRRARERARLSRCAGGRRRPRRPQGGNERLSRLAREGEWWPTVARLRCFRGIDTLSAFVLCLEIGDWTRFSRPAKLTGWLGLVPSLDQSGESRRQGAITKTGSGSARRLLLEAAWHYLPRPSVGPALAERRAGQPDHLLQVALRAQRRLHRLHHRLRARGKPGNVATVAGARELACFLGAAAVAD